MNLNIKKNVFYKAFLYPMFFLFFYAVRVIGFPNFSHLGLVFLPTLMLFSPIIGHNSKIIVKSKPFRLVVFCYLSFFFVTCAVSFLHGSGEISILLTILHSILSIPACLVIAAAVYSFSSTFSVEGLISFLGFLLKLQVFLIIFMLVNEGARNFIFDMLRDESHQVRMSGYHGSRGLGVAGSIAYGLAVFLSMQYLIYFFLKYNQNGSTFTNSDYIWMGMGAIALLSAGRTAVLGVVGLPVIIFLDNLKYRKVNLFKILKTVLVLCFLSLLVFFTLSYFNLLGLPSIERYIYYVYQPIELYLRTGSLEVSSVEALNNMYYYPGDFTFIFGDGRYAGVSGGYYGGVDAGYMRYILFGGVIYSVIVFSIFLFLNILLFKIINPKVKSAGILVSALVFMSLVFHYKGDFIIISVAYSKLYLFIVFFFILINRQDCLNKKTDILYMSS